MSSKKSRPSKPARRRQQRYVATTGLDRLFPGGGVMALLEQSEVNQLILDLMYEAGGAMDEDHLLAATEAFAHARAVAALTELWSKRLAMPRWNAASQELEWRSVIPGHNRPAGPTWDEAVAHAQEQQP